MRSDEPVVFRYEIFDNSFERHTAQALRPRHCRWLGARMRRNKISSFVAILNGARCHKGRVRQRINIWKHQPHTSVN